MFYLETAFSFCHFLFCFVLKSSNFITMLIINMPLFPMSAAELGKAMWCVSVETSSGWKLITFGGGGLWRVFIFSWIRSLNWLIEQSSKRQRQFTGRGLEHAAMEQGAAAACKWLGANSCGAMPFEEKHCSGLILICVEIFFFSNKNFFFFFLIQMLKFCRIISAREGI